MSVIYVDGGGKDSKGKSRVGVVAPTGNIILTLDNEMTSNSAEYLACLIGCALAQDGDIIVSDSQLVVNQVNGLWKLKANHLRKYFDAIIGMKYHKKLEFKWEAREHNQAGRVLERNLRNGV